MNQLPIAEGIPVTLASIYNPTDKNKILKEYLLVLIDYESSYSIAKASIVK